MELIVAILIALGALTSASDFTDDYIKSHGAEMSRATSIIDQGQYDMDGGVTIEPGVGL